MICIDLRSRDLPPLPSPEANPSFDATTPSQETSRKKWVAPDREPIRIRINEYDAIDGVTVDFIVTLINQEGEEADLAKVSPAEVSKWLEERNIEPTNFVVKKDDKCLCLYDLVDVNWQLSEHPLRTPTSQIPN